MVEKRLTPSKRKNKDIGVDNDTRKSPTAPNKQVDNGYMVLLLAGALGCV